jgi:hypothetical protein
MFVADFRPFWDALTPDEAARFRCVAFVVFGPHVLLHNSVAGLDSGEAARVFAWCAPAVDAPRLVATRFHASSDGDDATPATCHVFPRAMKLPLQLGGAALRLGVVEQNWCRETRKTRAAVLLVDSAAVQRAWDATGVVPLLPCIDAVLSEWFDCPLHKTVYAGAPTLQRTDAVSATSPAEVAAWLLGHAAVAAAPAPPPPPPPPPPAAPYETVLYIPGTPPTVWYNKSTGTVVAPVPPLPPSAAPTVVRRHIVGPPGGGKFAALCRAIAAADDAMLPLLLVMPAATFPWCVHQLRAAAPSALADAGAVVVLTSTSQLQELTWHAALAARVVLVSASLLGMAAVRGRKFALLSAFLAAPDTFRDGFGTAVDDAAAHEELWETYAAATTLHAYAAAHVAGAVAAAHAVNAPWLHDTGVVLDVLPFAAVVSAGAPLPYHCVMAATRFVRLVQHVDDGAALFDGLTLHVNAAPTNCSAAVESFALPWTDAERALRADADDAAAFACPKFHADFADDEPTLRELARGAAAALSETHARALDALAQQRDALAAQLARFEAEAEDGDGDQDGDDDGDQDGDEDGDGDGDEDGDEDDDDDGDEDEQQDRDGADDEAAADFDGDAEAGVQDPYAHGHGHGHGMVIGVMVEDTNDTEGFEDAQTRWRRLTARAETITRRRFAAAFAAAAAAADNGDTDGDGDFEDGDFVDADDIRAQLDMLDRRASALRSAVAMNTDADALRRRVDESAATVAAQTESCFVCAANASNVVLPCSHIICAVCATRWFANHTVCPTCKDDVRSVKAAAFHVYSGLPPAWADAARVLGDDTAAALWRGVQRRDVSSRMLWCLWQLADADAHGDTAAVVLPTRGDVDAFVKALHVPCVAALHLAAATRVASFGTRPPRRLAVFRSVQAGAAHVAVAYGDLCDGAGFDNVSRAILPCSSVAAGVNNSMMHVVQVCTARLQPPPHRALLVRCTTA